jgi:hypothetical protein
MDRLRRGQNALDAMNLTMRVMAISEFVAMESVTRGFYGWLLNRGALTWAPQLKSALSIERIGERLAIFICQPFPE